MDACDTEEDSFLPTPEGGDEMTGVTRKLQLTAWKASADRDDGGGRRLRAFRTALEQAGVAQEWNLIGPAAGTGRSVSAGGVHALKRRFLPMPLRSAYRREIRGGQWDMHTRVSLVPVANRWAITGQGPGWIDYPDLWSEYAKRHAEKEIGISRLVALRQAALWLRRESSEADRASIVTVASIADRSVNPKSIWLPTPIISKDSLGYRSCATSIHPRRAGFIANFDYPPNRDAYRLLRDEWCPTLRDRGVEVVIAGWGSENLDPSPGVHILGALDSVDEFYNRVDFALSPMSLGGGMKVKVVEALSRDVPVVGTEHSFDGLPHGVHQGITTWKRYSSESAWRLYSPMSMSDVRDGIETFTYESFNRTVRDIVSVDQGDR